MPTENRVRSSYIATAAHEARRLIRTYKDVWLILKEILIWLGRVMYRNVAEMVEERTLGSRENAVFDANTQTVLQ